MSRWRVYTALVSLYILVSWYVKLKSDSDVMLSCGIHSCPSKCHQLSDHSKMECKRVVKWKCTRGHSLAVACFKNNGACRFCTEEDEKKEKQRQRNLRLDIARAEKQKEYERVLASLQDEIEDERRRMKDQHDENERERVIERHRNELLRLKTKKGPLLDRTNVNSTQAGPPSSPKNPDEKSSQGGNQPSGKATDSSVNKPEAVSSPAQQEWDYLKKFERAQSDEIDTLMGMIGLEDVKAQFLTIKAQVDLAIRQRVDLSDERFGTVLIGNPGTGRIRFEYISVLTD